MAVKIIGYTSNPYLGGSSVDPKIHNIYFDLFNSMRSDTNAHISMYMWHNKNLPNNCAKWTCLNPAIVTQKMLDVTKARKPKVRILFDNDYLGPDKNGISEKDQMKSNQFVSLLKSYGVEEALYTTFKPDGTGRGSGHKIHNKTMLFSKLKFPSYPNKLLSKLSNLGLEGKTIYNVVVESSANIWETQYDQANHIVIYYNDANFYNFHLNRWRTLRNDLHSGRKIDETGGYTKHKDPTSNLDYIEIGGVKAFCFPRNDNPIVNILNYVNDTCRNIYIHVAIADFNNTSIANKLADIAKNKSTTTQVRVIRREDGVKPGQVVNILQNAGVEYSVAKTKYSRTKLHSKYLLIDAEFPTNTGGFQRRKYVWAGSLSYTTNALSTNSETLVRMQNSSLYTKFFNNWINLRNNAI